MGLGPALSCSICSRIFFGGKGYDEGVKNYCYECIVLLAKTISKNQYEELGQTQRGTVNLVLNKEIFDALGGDEGFIKMMKANAGELPKDVMD